MNVAELYTEQAVVDSLYRTYRAVDEVLRESGIRFYMIGGTLLGAIRHGGVIPWDDDGDLAVDEADFPRVRQEALPLLEQRGVSWSFGRMGNLKLFGVDGRKLRSEGNVRRPRYPIVDIFPFRLVGDVVTFSSPACRERWSAQYFSPADTAALVDLAFGPLRLPSVAEPAARVYLARTYGERWATEAEIGYSHLASERTATTRFRIEDLAPALPSPAATAPVPPPAGDAPIRVQVEDVRGRSARVSVTVGCRSGPPREAGPETEPVAVDAAWWRSRLHDVRRRLLPPSALPAAAEVTLDDVTAARLPRGVAAAAVADYVHDVVAYVERGHPPTGWFLLNALPLFPVGAADLDGPGEPGLGTLARGITAEVCSLFEDALACYDAAARHTGWGTVLAWRLRTRLGRAPRDVAADGLSPAQVAALREEQALGTGVAAAASPAHDGPAPVILASAPTLRAAYAADNPTATIELLSVPAALGCDEAQLRIARLLAAAGRTEAARHWLYESARTGNPNAVHEWTRSVDGVGPVDGDGPVDVLDRGARCGDVTARILLEAHRGGGALVLYGDRRQS